MASIGIGLDDRLWRLERLHVQRDLTDLQVHGDPDDEDGLALSSMEPSSSPTGIS